MKIKKILIILIIALSIILTGVNANAAEAEISAKNKNVEVGDTVTIDVSFTAAAWNLTVSGDKISGDSYASQTSDLSEQETKKSFTMDTSKAGEYTVNLSGDITDKDGKTTKINESVTIKVSEPEPDPEPEQKPDPEPEPEPEPEQNPESEPKPEPTKSSDATLKMLGLGTSAKNPSKYDFSGFKSSKTSYDVTVPYEVKNLEVYYTVNNGKAKCTVSGNDNFEIGKNEIKLTVTAEDGTQKTYTINVTREEEQKLSGDATLSNLGIGKSASEPSEYDFTGFTKNTYEYSVTVPYEVTTLDVYYKVSKSSSIADVSGSSDFKVGKNEINILVTAEDGTQKTYTINVTRLAENTVTTKPGENEQTQTQEPEANGLQLDNLEISKGELSPEFSGSVTDYTVTVGSSVEKIDITAVANDETATIEIAGNEGLKEGKNIVTVLVRSSDDSEIVTYQINVTKKSGFDIAGFLDDKENQNIMIILGVILILIIIIIILLIREGRKDDEDDYEEEVKVKTKKRKAKRFKDDSENVNTGDEDVASEETDSVNK